MISKREKELLDLVFYQIYPRSFYDANGDGVGDLRGITQKIPHLKKLGINAVWLCPCYPSPYADNGYDISNYVDIHPQLGSMQDWETLKNALHSQDIRLIMDFVANHTSDEHPFFQQAKTSTQNPYHNYYIWSKTPNDWQSIFGGKAWKYNPDTKEYYLHSFHEKQPDLNWCNKKVRQEMCAVVDFWAKKGVDGFRCDVLDFIAKDFSQNKMFGGKQLSKYIRELFGRKSTHHLFTVGECQADEDSVCDICGMEAGKLTTVFQFNPMRVCGEDKFHPKRFRFDALRKTLVRWQNFTQEKQIIPTLFTDNHDYPFFLSRYGNDEIFRYECATLFASMVFLLRGIPFVYQSQEYGNVNPYYDDVSAFNDVETLNKYAETRKKRGEKKAIRVINIGSRDNARRPFAWTNDKQTNYGFSIATPWLQTHSKAEKINLQTDEKANKSIFRFYQELFSLRKQYACFRYGTFRDLTEQKNTFVYERSYKNQRAIVICNYGKARKIPLPYTLNSANFALCLGNNEQRKSQPFSALFQPFETAVFLSIKNR